MSHKFEFANLLSIEQTIPARAATRTLNEPEFLIKADRVHADGGQLGGRTNVHRFCHASTRINPGVMSRVKRGSSNPQSQVHLGPSLTGYCEDVPARRKN